MCRGLSARRCGRQIRREQVGRRLTPADLAALCALDAQLKPYVAKLRQSMIHPSTKARARARPR